MPAFNPIGQRVGSGSLFTSTLSSNRYRDLLLLLLERNYDDRTCYHHLSVTRTWFDLGCVCFWSRPCTNPSYDPKSLFCLTQPLGSSCCVRPSPTIKYASILDSGSSLLQHGLWTLKHLLYTVQHQTTFEDC